MSTPLITIDIFCTEIHSVCFSMDYTGSIELKLMNMNEIL
jgi:hypothetical protein